MGIEHAVYAIAWGPDSDQVVYSCGRNLFIKPIQVIPSKCLFTSKIENGGCKCTTIMRVQIMQENHIYKVAHAFHTSNWPSWLLAKLYIFFPCSSTYLNAYYLLNQRFVFSVHDVPIISLSVERPILNGYFLRWQYWLFSRQQSRFNGKPTKASYWKWIGTLSTTSSFLLERTAATRSRPHHCSIFSSFCSLRPLHKSWFRRLCFSLLFTLLEQQISSRWVVIQAHCCLAGGCEFISLWVYARYPLLVNEA